MHQAKSFERPSIKQQWEKEYQNILSTNKNSAIDNVADKKMSDLIYNKNGGMEKFNDKRMTYDLPVDDLLDKPITAENIQRYNDLVDGINYTKLPEKDVG
jgi:hypothetical protein